MMVHCYQRNKRRRVDSRLPLEIIIEILSWLPIDSLMRFKCVCKQWCSLIQDCKFIVKHRDHTNVALPISSQYKWEKGYELAISDKNFKLTGWKGGLFLEKSVTSRVCRIRNPATHQVLYLPDVHEDTKHMDLAFNSCTGEHKAICFPVKEAVMDTTLAGLQVITIGDEKWNQNLMNRGLLNPDWSKADDFEWFFYLPEIKEDGDDLYLQIQCFDLWSESFITTTTLPRGVFLDLEQVYFFLWDNRPAVADIAGEALNVLVLEDFKQHKWCQNKIIVPLKFLKDDPRLKDQIVVRKAQSNVLKFTQRDKLISYDMKTETTKVLKYSELGANTTYKSDLMTLKGMRPERSAPLEQL